MTAGLKEIFLDSITACHPDHWMTEHLDERAARSETGFTHLFAVGKAGYAMATAAMHHPILQHACGMVVIPHDLSTEALPLDIIRAAHPIPDVSSFTAGSEIHKRMASLQRSDRFLFLLSGGSSSLMEDPIPPLTHEDVTATHQLLLRSGLPIHMVNRVRTALSAIKGGGLAASTRASGTVLVMSDVPDNRLDVIGSGPLYPVHRYPHIVCSLLKEAGIWVSLPTRVRDLLGNAHRTSALKSKGNPHIGHQIVLDNRDFLEQIAHACRRRRIHPVIMPEQLQGEAREAGRQIAQQSLDHVRKQTERPAALIWGGETTVTVTGTGRGGRSQEACLSALITAVECPGITFLFAGTDGIDGPTDAAGAIASPPQHTDQDSLRSMERYLANQDSYTYFERTDSLLKTGWTGINVMDVAVALIHPQ